MTERDDQQALIVWLTRKVQELAAENTALLEAMIQLSNPGTFEPPTEPDPPGRPS